MTASKVNKGDKFFGGDILMATITLTRQAANYKEVDYSKLNINHYDLPLLRSKRLRK